MDSSDFPGGVSPAAVRQLARELGLITLDELQALTGVKTATLEAWRKRGLGPPHVFFGNQVYYPIAGVAEHLKERVRERCAVPAKELL